MKLQVKGIFKNSLKINGILSSGRTVQVKNDLLVNEKKIERVLLIIKW